MKRLIRIISFFIIILIFLNTSAIADSINTHDKKVVIFVIDRINLKDYTMYNLPNLKYLLENGTYGIMTVNSDGGRIPENIYMTIGSGTRAVGSDAAASNFNSYEIVDGETAADIFQRNSGIVPQKDNILNLDIAQIYRNNLKSNHIVVPGLLGKMLNDSGRTVAVFGNEDTDKEQKRFTPLIGMNDKGIVNYGDVSTDILKRDLLSPFGIMTDYDMLYKKYNEMKAKADLTIFQLGDTSRVNDYQRYATDKINALNKKKALENADSFIGKIIREGRPDTLYMVITPMPSSKDIGENNYLTPIIIYGPGFTGGFLTSETTKRAGIVTNMDIMPTILKYFNIKIPAYVTGHPLNNSGYKGTIQELIEQNNQLVYNYTYRPPFLKTYVALQIIILLLSLAVLVFFKKYSIYMKPLLFFVSAIPLTFLLLPLLNYTRISNSIVGVFFLTAVAIISIYKFSPYSYYFYAIISFITSLVLTVDLSLGGFLLKNSFLSYDVIAGARFYGIGNEYMGVLIGGTICFTTIAFETFKNKKLLFVLTSLIYLLVFYFIAAPNMGTNVGGGIAAFGGFGAALILLSGKKINIKNFIYICIGILIMLLALFYIDSMRPVSQQTHIGQTFALVRSYGIIPLIQIFVRKLTMNYKLLKYSIWSKVLLTLIAVLLGLFFKPVGVLNDIFKKHNYIRVCFLSTIIGSVFALIFNDSGIVAAATMMVFMGPMLIHFVIDEIAER